MIASPLTKRARRVVPTIIALPWVSALNIILRTICLLIFIINRIIKLLQRNLNPSPARTRGNNTSKDKPSTLTTTPALPVLVTRIGQVNFHRFQKCPLNYFLTYYFLGVLTTKNGVCKEVNCGITIHNQQKLVNRCTPKFYTTSAGHQSCCPIEWNCQNKEKMTQNRNSTATSA